MTNNDEIELPEPVYSDEHADDVLALPPEGHPLRRLGQRLTELLDEDHWAECERLLLQGWDHDRIDRKTGQHWRENSSLEVWFPFSAEELEKLRRERAQAAEPVAWMDQDGNLHTTLESATFSRRPVTPLYTTPARPAVTSWQPIENAPMDGRWMLLGSTHACCMGYWDGTCQTWRDQRDLERAPTHWMPLPEAPEAALGGGHGD